MYRYERIFEKCKNRALNKHFLPSFQTYFSVILCLPIPSERLCESDLAFKKKLTCSKYTFFILFFSFWGFNYQIIGQGVLS